MEEKLEAGQGKAAFRRFFSRFLTPIFLEVWMHISFRGMFCYFWTSLVWIEYLMPMVQMKSLRDGNMKYFDEGILCSFPLYFFWTCCSNKKQDSLDFPRVCPSSGTEIVIRVIWFRLNFLENSIFSSIDYPWFCFLQIVSKSCVLLVWQDQCRYFITILGSIKFSTPSVSICSSGFDSTWSLRK